MAAIDVGAAAIGRGSNFGGDYTLITIDNPANDTGLITSVEAWLQDAANAMRAATFYTATNYKCRAGQDLGAVASGSKQTISGLTISVSTGDYIGCYLTTGRIERDLTGYAGIRFVVGDQTQVDDEAVYTSATGDTLSLYGIGATGQTYEAAVTEALTTAESLARTITTGRSVSENLTSGEALADQAVYNAPAIAEGLTLAEALATWYGTMLDIGSPAIDRAGATTTDKTHITKDNPANASGILTHVEIWAQSTTTGSKVGTFSGSGVSYTNRDYAAIGAVTSGSKQTFTGLSIDVISGDFIGHYCSAGHIEYASPEGLSDVYRKDGDQFGAGAQTYTLYTPRDISLYGTVGGQTFQAHVSEGLTAAEAIARVIAVDKVLAEALTVAEVLGVQQDSQASVSEALVSSESLVAKAAYQLAVSEGATLAETLVRSFNLQSVLAEAMTASDVLARMVSSDKSLTESLTLNEVPLCLRQVYATLAEALGIADSSMVNLELYLLTLQLCARALTIQRHAASLTVKLHDRDYTATMEA